MELKRSKEWWLEKARQEGNSEVGAGMRLLAAKPSLWRRLMRWLHAYEVHVCPWCGGEILVRDELPVHMGTVCSRWKANSG